MRTMRFVKSQSAQGLVEFALVLPVLMLIILGVFAFGHYFFSYSSIVSASREAARWGAAVGASTNTSYRYMDCQAIRDAAVRVGSFAGVTPANVAIAYDHGPKQDGSVDAPYSPTCPPPGITLGDRILITVTVPYRPIVAFLNLPSFNIVATTSRTIITNLEVGEAPTAAPLIPTTTISIIPVGSSGPDLTLNSSMINTPQTFNVVVTASNNSIPAGTVVFQDLTSGAYSSCGNSFTPGANSTTCTITFNTLGAHALQATLTTSSSYISPQQPAKLNWFVAQALTTTTITSVSPANKQREGVDFIVNVNVAAQPPATGTPYGNVVVQLGSDPAPAAKALDASGNASFTLSSTTLGQNILYAYFQGNNAYGPSTGTIPYTIVNKLNPVITITSNPVAPLTLDATGRASTTFTVTVTNNAGDPSIPTGPVTLTDDATPKNTCTSALDGTGTMSCPTWTYTKAGSYTVTATFNGDNNYKTGTQTLTPFVVNTLKKQNPSVVINSASPASGSGAVNSPVTFSFTVSPQDPTFPIPTGTVTLSDTSGHNCTGSLDANGRGACSITFSIAGTFTFTATYNGDKSSNIASSSSFSYTIPLVCQQGSGVSLVTNGLEFNVNNSSGLDANLSSIVVNWPSYIQSPSSPFLNTIFFTPSSSAVDCSNNACIWTGSLPSFTNASPSTYTINSGTTGWNPYATSLSNNGIKILRLVYNGALVPGNYSVRLNFGGWCVNYSYDQH